MFTYSWGFVGPFLPSFSTHPMGFTVKLPIRPEDFLFKIQSHTLLIVQVFLSMSEPLQGAWFGLGFGRHTLK